MSSKSIPMIVVIALVGIGLAVFFTSKKEAVETHGGSGKIRWHTYDEGVVLAREGKKKLLVDVYTDWCSWCKKMDSDVYADERIRAIVETSFIAVKLNAESNSKVSVGTDQLDEAGLARAMGVSGYPTTVFLDSISAPITKISGYMGAKEFAIVLRFIGEDHYTKTTFEQFKASADDASKN